MHAGSKGRTWDLSLTTPALYHLCPLLLRIELHELDRLFACCTIKLMFYHSVLRSSFYMYVGMGLTCWNCWRQSHLLYLVCLLGLLWLIYVIFVLVFTWDLKAFQISLLVHRIKGGSVFWCHKHWLYNRQCLMFCCIPQHLWEQRQKALSINLLSAQHDVHNSFDSSFG